MYFCQMGLAFLIRVISSSSPSFLITYRGSTIPDRRSLILDLAFTGNLPKRLYLNAPINGLPQDRGGGVRATQGKFDIFRF